AALLSLLIILFVMGRMRNRAATFVIGAAWLRYVMSAFHTVTYRPLVAGMSANALGSMGTFAVGLLCINWRHLALRFLLPFYVLIALAITSAIANDGFTPGLVTVITKHGYLIVIILCVFGAMRRMQERDFMSALLWAFFPPLVFQALSIAFGIGKLTETDATATSYIGGYNHEAAFSVILATCLTVACFTTKLHKHLRTGIVLLCVFGVVMANYRTTLVAIGPLVVRLFVFSSFLRFPLRDRPLRVSCFFCV